MSLKQPVQYPVKYYSHADTDAPQLADADGVIKTILKACLVTGYGTKEGAGWTSLFEDDYRIVLRRPLQTSNPPDIKIENGVINGTASHRIVSQDNPSGLDDATELAAVNLLARDSKCGVEWHLIVSDFGFWFGYQMGDKGYVGSKGYFMYCGSVQKILDSGSDQFVVNSDPQVESTGLGTAYVRMFLDPKNKILDMRQNTFLGDKRYLDTPVGELHFNNDYMAQKVIVLDNALLPFFCAVPKNYANLNTDVVSISGRMMLRYVNKLLSNDFSRAFYIPLDYWEL